ncbi:MAG: methyl-accepting chemotaxis protein [Pseudomonadota bacterium]|nr:chemotaxis protein [Pseudomonadales bacterium]MDY6921343.1 methyl-accepting chemotaxis protein [Pseudomonadota bacterium]
MSSSTGKLESSKSTNLIPVYIIGLVVTIGLMLLNFFNVANHSEQAAKYVTKATELRVLSQRIAKNALEAASGNADAFSFLDQARVDFGLEWDAIKNGSPDEGIEADSIFITTASQEMADVERIWKQVSDNSDVILEGRQTVINLHDVARVLNESIPVLQEEYDLVVQILVDSKAPADQVAVAQRQSLLAERIVRSVNKVLEGGEDAVMAADSFGQDTERFGRVLQGMLEGDRELGITRVRDRAAVESLNEISDLFAAVNESVDEILESSPELFQVRAAANGIFKDSQNLLTETGALARSFESTPVQGFWSTLFGIIFAALALLFLLLIFFSFIAQTRGRLAEEEQRREEKEMQNQHNQEAILRLLDELGDLADGDLTIQTTVTEDFTGAIADSINFTIDQLRSLVSTINETAVQVSAAAQETQATAMHLAEASEHQAQEIAGASAAINEMAVSIDQVSANAAESAAVAERSVSIANKGAEVVQNTIHGMDTIREQIQETSKRIKRLGESSQEIGDIVSLINDIADQTNILALNAAIQASMAGEAGRGFAVVADEVQRLAERSSAATKQIEALVKTIQTDTNEAVISMEQTTSEVVRGARLAQDAGVALEEIENVSSNLADLIQNISNAARQQAASAGHISNTMNVIQEITSQTSAGTTATATSIGNLAELAVQMRNSVAGFKLPETEM